MGIESIFHCSVGPVFASTTRTQGTKIATEELKGRVLEVPIDLRARHFRGGETSKIFSPRELSFWTPKLVVWFNVSPFPFGCIFRFQPLVFGGNRSLPRVSWWKWSDLTNMFQIGWNHQLQVLYVLSSWCFFWSTSSKDWEGVVRFGEAYQKKHLMFCTT